MKGKILMKRPKRFVLIALVCFWSCSLLLATPARAQYEGSWSGPLTSFTVTGDKVRNLQLTLCFFGDCNDTMTWSFSNDIPISGNTFSYDGVQNYVRGTFTSPTTCSIDWENRNLQYSPDVYVDLKGTYTANLIFIHFSPSRLDFGQHFVGTQSDISSFELNNVSDAIVTGSVQLSGAHADQFEIISGEGDFSLAPGQSKTVSVKFIPTSTGGKKAALTTEIAQPINNANSAYLSGTGTSPVLSVIPGYRNVSASAGSTSFAVANTGSGTMPWSVVRDPAETWITITNETSGIDSGTIAVSFEANNGPDRTAILTVEAPGALNSPKHVEVRQGSPTLSVTPDQRDVFANHGRVEFSIANLSGGIMNWTVSTDSPWITDIQPNSGTNNATVTVTYEATAGEERSGLIRILADGAINSPKTVKLSQSASEWKLLADKGADSAYFGYSVSISGDYAIVGAYGDDYNGPYTGSACIYKRIGTEWVQQAKLTASDGAASDYFGRSVSISNNVAIVGAPGKTSGKGSAYIFEIPIDGWKDMTQTAKLNAIGVSSSWYVNAAFGRSVSIVGSNAIVGAPGDGGGKGSAFIFEKPVGGCRPGLTGLDQPKSSRGQSVRRRE